MTNEITSGSMTFDASAPLVPHWGFARGPVEAYTFYEPPKPVGYWKLGYNGVCCTKFSMYKRPTDEQIKNHYEMLGWEWEDAV